MPDIPPIRGRGPFASVVSRNPPIHRHCAQTPSPLLCGNECIRAATSKAQKAHVDERVRKILADPAGPDVPRLEAEIDQLIYTLYGLTEPEIALVEAKKNGRQETISIV